MSYPFFIKSFMELPNDNNPPQEGRPKMLTILCILSFIGSGMGLLAYTFYGLMYNEVESMIEHGQFSFPGIEILMSGGSRYFLIGAFFYLISFLGVYLMWRMRTIGFHFYTAAQILMLIFPFLALENYPIPFVDFIITLIFIFLYRKFLPIMN